MLKTENMTAWWPLDGNATDYSGGGNTGAVTGAAVSAGKFGQCYYFDGSDDNINVGAGLFATGKHAQGTCAAWLNVKVAPSSQTADYKYPGIWSKGDVYSIFGVQKDRKVLVYFYDTGTTGRSVLSNTVLTLETWYHVAATWNADGTNIYINGALDKTDALTWTNMHDGGSAQDMLLGRTVGYAVLNGYIGNLIFWDRVLSEQMIKRVMLNLHPF